MGESEARIGLITGGGRGIGAATAVELAKAGLRVVVTSRTQSQLDAAVDAVAEVGGEALPVVCDVSRPEQVEGLFAAVKERWGPVDVLVNNAGTLSAGPFADMPRADWDRTLAVNLTAVYLCTQAALKHMLPRKRGVIVNVASVAGIAGVEKLPGLVAYAATKGAVIQLSEALGAELQDQGVRVVAVSPGAVNTEMLRSVAPDFAPQAMTPDAVAQVIAFLASDAAAGVTKVNVPVWGPPAGA